MNAYLRWFGVIAGSFAMLACTVMQPLTIDAAQLRQELKRGDKVEISVGSGQHVEFTVDSVDEKGIHGGGRTIAYTDIRRIERKEISTGRTVLLIIAVVAAGAALASGGGGGGGSGGGGY
jgi:hypothetical protein